MMIAGKMKSKVDKLWTTLAPKVIFIKLRSFEAEISSDLDELEKMLG